MTITIALAGNPNVGKTTLFNRLTGLRQHVGNWPRVTVERKQGRLGGHPDVDVIDLPGIYSLAASSLEEIIAQDYLTGQRPDVVVNVVDGANLERNLFLTDSLLDLELPMVVAVNMIDEVAAAGQEVRADVLAEGLGCPVVAVSALKGRGLEELVEVALETARAGQAPDRGRRTAFPDTIEELLAQIETQVTGPSRRFAAIKVLEREPSGAGGDEALNEALNAAFADAIVHLEAELGDSLASAMILERYRGAAQLARRALIGGEGEGERVNWSDRIDAVVTNRWLALPIFAAVIFAVYYTAVTTVGAWVTDWTNDGFFGDGWTLGSWEVPGIPALLGGWLEAISVAPWLQGLIVDGIIGGVGAVLGFVPQMMVLFALLAALEGCGYIARVAFILDRAFRRFGLSGKSFIPMLISTGCGIPGVMAARTIDSANDRRMTVMTTTFMPCGAKLPIIALIAGAVFDGAWWVAPSAYFLGVGAIIVSGLILKKTRPFQGLASPFVMELPPYRWPQSTQVLRVMWERAWSFIKRAGTIILVSAVVIWFLSSFGVVQGRFEMVEDLDQGFLAGIAGAVAWVFAPLGFGAWEATVATLTGLVAKENVVGTLGVLYGFAEPSEDGGEFWSSFAMNFTAVSAFSFLAFNLLCAPCFAAIGAIHREMNNARWTWFAIGYQTAFAYGVALMLFQFGSLATGQSSFGAGTVAALALAALLVFLLVRRPSRPPSAGPRLDDAVKAATP
ncbi:MAG: ferrous iron transport protein B [Bifidobacteriaceae bacterium]|jgi:ferrous iron transport protein B|nr:ferrous iron transport protein B [Bifidobacteriaceae bacterium]